MGHTAVGISDPTDASKTAAVLATAPGSDTGQSAVAVRVISQLGTSAGASTPTGIFTGKTAVTTAGTRVTLASSQAVVSVTVKALAGNTGTIYVGNTAVASTNGFALAAGDSVSMDIANLNTVNLDASVSGEGVTYLGVG